MKQVVTIALVSAASWLLYQVARDSREKEQKNIPAKAENEKKSQAEATVIERTVALSAQDSVEVKNIKIGELPQLRDKLSDKIVDSRYQFSSENAGNFFRPVDPNGRFAKDTLVLLAEIKPPTYEKWTLQASDVAVSGKGKEKKIYVSYNMIGEKFLGGVQVFSWEESEKTTYPQLLQTIIFKNFDVHSLTVKNNVLYLVGGTEDGAFKTPSCLEMIKLEEGLIPKVFTSIRLDLPSFAATSVKKIKGMVAVTVGDQNGGVVLIKKPLTLPQNKILHYQDVEHEFFEIHDARYVDIDKHNIYAVKGTEAGLWVYPRNGSTPPQTIELSGATIPESKSTVQANGDFLYLGLGDGGTNILDIHNSFKTVQKIPQLLTDSLPPEKTVTNAVTGWQKEFFTADGEGGMRVFRFDPKHKKAWPMAAITFGPKQSVNAIKYIYGHLFLATGLGGVKMVQLIRHDAQFSKDEKEFFHKFQTEFGQDD